MKITIKSKPTIEKEFEFRLLGTRAEPVLEIKVENQVYLFDWEEFKRLFYIY